MTEAIREPIGVGILGATGYIGTAYRAEIRESAAGRILALSARRKNLLGGAAREDGAEFASTDWRAVIEHPGVDLVIVATPDAQHLEGALACAKAGKHVFCEKPVGFDAGEAWKIWNAFRNLSGVAHFVPFWSRYLKMFARARELFHDGAIGEARSVIYRWFNPRPADILFTWRDDPAVSAGGTIADVGSHAYDMMRWILDEDAVRVLAHSATISPDRHDAGPVNLSEALAWSGPRSDKTKDRRKAGTADYAAIAFEMEGGCTGTLLVSHAHHMRKNLAPELEIHGTAASLSVHRGTGNVTLVRTGGEPEVIATDPEVFGNRFERFVFPAVTAVRSGQPSDHPDLEDGYHAQRFTDAAARAAACGHWIEIE